MSSPIGRYVRLYANQSPSIGQVTTVRDGKLGIQRLGSDSTAINWRAPLTVEILRDSNPAVVAALAALEPGKSGGEA